MLLRKLTLLGLLASVLASAGASNAMVLAPDWDRKKIAAQAVPRSEESSPGRGDDPPELLTLKPRPVPKVPSADKPPAKPQPKPRPKPVQPGASPGPSPGAPAPAPKPPITRPS